MPSAATVSPTLLSAPVSWTRLSNFDAFVVFLKSGSMIRRLASLHWLRSGTVRQLRRYYQGAMTSCRPSRRTSLPSLGGTSALHSFCSLLGGRVRRRGLELVDPVSPAGIVAEETTGSPKFLGNPNCPFAHVQSTPAGLLAPDHYGAAAWPLVCEKQRLPRKVFRRSIAWLSDSLSTLRSAGYPAPTQDSLPAAGQALPDGLFHPQGSDERFQSCFLHLIPLSQACLAQSPYRLPYGTACACRSSTKVLCLSSLFSHCRCDRPATWRKNPEDRAPAG